MNCSKSSHFIFVVVLSFLALSAAPQVRAESLCAALKAVLDDANNEFKRHRGSFDFTRGEYEGTRAFYPLTDCHTESAQGVANYECALRKLADDAAQVKGQFDAIHAQVLKCLGEDVKVARKKDDRVTYRYIPEDKDITLRYQRMTPTSNRRNIPPSYSLMLSVDAVDLHKH